MAEKSTKQLERELRDILNKSLQEAKVLGQKQIDQITRQTLPMLIDLAKLPPEEAKEALEDELTNLRALGAVAAIEAQTVALQTTMAVIRAVAMTAATMALA
jgi:hypothetical protein